MLLIAHAECTLCTGQHIFAGSTINNKKMNLYSVCFFPFLKKNTFHCNKKKFIWAL